MFSFSRWALLFVAVSMAISAQEFPDGIWNGKPWSKEELTEGVKRNDPDALAEWVDCADFAELSIPCDREALFKYATQAAEQGSILGKLKVGEALIAGYGTKPDRLKGLEIITEASEAGHPAATSSLATYRLSRSFKDFDKALALLETIKDQPLRYADYNQYLVYRNGAHGFVDREDALKALVRSFEKTKDIRSATKIYYEVFSKKGGAGILTDELAQQARERLQEAVDLHHDLACYGLGYHLIKSENPNQGVPLMLEAAAQGSYRAVYTITHFCRSPEYKGDFGGYTVAGDQQSAFNGAAYLYRNNFNRDNMVIARSYADYLTQEKHRKKSPTTLDDEAVKVYRRIIAENRSDNRNYMSLASYIALADYGKKGNNPEATEHARNILIYRSEADSIASHWLSRGYSMNSNRKRKDYAKGYAALTYALTKSRNDFRKVQKDWMKHTEEKMSPEQKEEAERLIKDGFPYARKYREAAFEYLKEKGDIPNNWVFDDDLPKEENEEAFVPAPGALGPLFALMTQAPFLALSYDSDDSLQLLSKLAEGGKFSEEELPRLTELLLSEDTVLLEKAEKLSPEFRLKISTAIENQNQLVRKGTALGERIAWFIYCDLDGNCTSRPVLPNLSSSSIAQASGLQSGDIFQSLYGIDLKSNFSRNRFVRLLALWPKEEKLKLVVLRAKYNSHSLAYANTHDIETKITVSLLEDKSEPEEKAE